jgi:hypothetical protein
MVQEAISSYHINEKIVLVFCKSALVLQNDEGDYICIIYIQQLNYYNN